MTKKIYVNLFVLLLCAVSLPAIELGVIGGTVSNPSRFNYGLSAGMGLLVPMVKAEVEYYRKTTGNTDNTNNTGGTEALATVLDSPVLSNAVTAGVKLRPRFGKISPYAVLGVGAEFEGITLHFSQYETFTFIGGGLHFHLLGMLSLRGDIRFLNYSSHNRVRLNAGVYFHL